MRHEYRAIFEYPNPRGGLDTAYGPARETLEEAEQERPWRPEESRGRHVGVQIREVTPWHGFIIIGKHKKETP